MTGGLPAEVCERAWRIARRVRSTMNEGDPRDFPVDAFQLLTGCGFMTVPLDRRCGGIGLGRDPGTQGALLELLAIVGWGDLSVARLYEGHLNALLLVQQFGTPEQIERAAADARQGLVFGVWNTEGANGLRLESPEGKGLRLCGGKTYASGAASIERPLVTARDERSGWQLVLLEMERIGAALDGGSWETFGMRASQSLTIDLTGARIEPRQLIGSDGDYYRQPWFSGGAIRFCAAQLGGAAALLDLARDELVARNRSGDPLQRERIGQAASRIASGMAMLDKTACLADDSRFGGGTGEDDARLLAAVNLTRTAIERTCLETMELVERSLGAGAQMATHPAARIAVDLRLYLRQPAPDASLLAGADYLLSSDESMLSFWHSGQ